MTNTSTSTSTPGPARIRVALVDDQALFRTGIRMLIGSQPDLQFVGEAGDGAEGIELVRRNRPDVVLMDVRMPVKDGISATADIVSSGSDAKVLVLTTFDFDEAAAKAIRAGASGFVLKDADPEFLLAAIRTVHAGTTVFAASATRELLRRYEDPADLRATVPAAFGDLTPREREIFDLAARGLSNAEIASHEYVSEATVKTHISRVLTKLGLRDRVRLVVFAHEHGLVTKGE
ncbi:DNA-binding NarL/FixJ family response regulator [Curtobacterium flaccumfaciens]|uniref:DNA-binding NarL/FixJ family response regulator n=1 Tax=Curtobacterium salicis TaxID=1779862 RepID=A0ABX0T3K1_9MICO|nr:response regulator transcription factor [Curtobacterium sp. WW7]NII40067.1 DNA-binding NarL/FixJ family response regulator [Curtobacterium sp. WW7]